MPDGDVRRAYKRSKSSEAPKKVDPRMKLAIFGGEIFCPMKRGIIGIETCGTIQNTRCVIEYACYFSDKRDAFLAEAQRVKRPAQTTKRRRKKEPTDERPIAD